MISTPVARYLHIHLSDAYLLVQVTCETFNDAISKLFTFCDAARASVIIDVSLDRPRQTSHDRS